MRNIIVAALAVLLLSGCNDVYNGVQPTQVANVGNTTESTLGVAYVAVAPVSVVDLDEERGD